MWSSGQISLLSLVVIARILFGQAAVVLAQESKDAALMERIRQLEQRAQQVDVMAKKVRELETYVDVLHDKLKHVEAASREAASDQGMASQETDRRRQIIQEEIDRALADWPGSVTATTSMGYGEGLELGFWVWLSYLHSEQGLRDVNTFWAWEVELDVTQTFTERIAGSLDIEFIDLNKGSRAEIEQAFLSIVLAEGSQTLLTMGKFNAPFGVEPRDFWDRMAASTSLLFKAKPQDLTGIMVTQPLGKTAVTVRPFVVNGFDDDLDNNNQPSVGLMAEYRPNENLRLALTNWWGPELANDNSNKLYLLDAQAIWQMTPGVKLLAEYLFATMDSPSGSLQWSGIQAAANYDVNDQWRVYGRWSFLHDRDGFVTATAQRRHELSTGVGFYLHPLVELRAEYRHDFSDGGDDLDMWSAHATFGF